MPIKEILEGAQGIDSILGFFTVILILLGFFIVVWLQSNKKREDWVRQTSEDYRKQNDINMSRMREQIEINHKTKEKELENAREVINNQYAKIIELTTKVAELSIQNRMQEERITKLEKMVMELQSENAVLKSQINAQIR